jgi:class 3 adenylate cyclase/tetratricopeptide (TPR) repeat protein
MNCPNCQASNPEQAKFCMNCGTSLSQIVRERDRSRLVLSGSVETGEAKSTDFNLNRYLPQELLTKFESARARNSMVGERRVITMLFCDVKGSTAAAEKVDPEIWTDIMNGVFEYMIRPIYKYEGLVPRLMGDAILAFFGAPITHEDDPQRAVLAGLEIQQGIKPYADEIRRKYGLEFGLRVGINTGLVVVGEIGSDLRMEYTAIGDAINLAARMEQTAQVGTIQISEETYKLVSPFFELEPLGDIEVKGKATPVKTYRVLSIKSTPGQLRGLDGLSSPLVGREAQLDLLNARLKALENGRGSVVSVIGEAGLGKSTLIATVKKSEEGQELKWLRGDALSYARSVSYFPWRQVIRQSIDAHEADSPAEVRHKLGYVCDCCTLPGGDMPFLEAMLAVESEESLQIVSGYQGEALVQRMVEATRGYLCGLATEAPLVIVLDDLHWADEASLNLLTSLVTLIESQPILFICLSRPDHTVSAWDTIQEIQQALTVSYYLVHLQPLQRDQTDLLLENLLGIKDLPKAVRDLIVEKADGNPFFIEEIIRSLIETHQIVRENSHWQAVSAEANLALPNTLRGVLNARIDRLPETTKHVLQNAAVVGRSFDLQVLKRLMNLNGDLVVHIQYLQEASLIEPFREEYAFRHVLLQEAAYDSILLKTRASLHKLVGETLEEFHAGRIDEFAPLLAYHFFSAQDERSLKYDVMAGEKAARLFANAEAATHFSRALRVAKRAVSVNGPNQIAQLHKQLGQVLELSGRYEQALENYDEMQSFAREQGDRSLEMSALMAKATIYSIFSQLHNSALSEQMLLEALQISHELGDHATQAKLNWNLMLTYLFSKQLDKALPHGEVALALARESGDQEQLAFVLNDLCRLFTCLGEFERAHTVIRQAREIWRSIDHQVMLADSLGSETETYFNAGEYEPALECCAQALQICERINNLWGQSYNEMLMSFALFEQGKLGRGIELAGRSNQLADEAGLLASSICMRSELAWVYAYCGTLDKGLPLLDQAMQAAESKQPEWKAFPRAAKVRMHLLMDDIESAKQAMGNNMIQATSIPYARYTIFVCLANIELAAAIKDFAKTLTLADELLEETVPLTRVDIPAVLRWKGIALAGLGRLEEAHQVLTEACSRARETDSNLHLWMTLVDLAKVRMKLGDEPRAKEDLEEARTIVKRIAESLQESGLRDSFLNQPQVRSLTQL